VGRSLQADAFSTDNLASCDGGRCRDDRGYRPAPWVDSLAGSYTGRDPQVLAVNGTSIAQNYFYVGESHWCAVPKTIRDHGHHFPPPPPPPHSQQHPPPPPNARPKSSAISEDQTLDTRPHFGISGRFVYSNQAIRNLGGESKLCLAHGVTVYANLRNALDPHYEEIFVYHPRLLNFVREVK